MSAAFKVLSELVLGIGLLVLAPFWVVCFFQLLKWWHIAERQLKPGAYVADSRPLLLAFFGRTAVLFQPEMLTEKGLEARRVAIMWFRRMMLLVAAAAALLWLNELVHPGGDWRAADPQHHRRNAVAASLESLAVAPARRAPVETRRTS